MKHRLTVIVGLMAIVMLGIGFTAEDVSLDADVERHLMELDEAKELTASWQLSHMGEVYAMEFPAGVYDALLNQDDAVGIRSYLAHTPEGQNTLVMVAVDKNNDDLIGGLIFELSGQCPPDCGLTNELSESNIPIL